MLATYMEMLAYRRPAFSDTDGLFIQKFLEPLGVKKDDFGNVYKKVGDSTILWSSHTDTVHKSEGLQRVTIDGNTAKLLNATESNCLGADCTTGVWLMTEMIKAKVPGLYVFHRAEERGGRGSAHISMHQPELLKGIKSAIAFDRYGTNSVITFQGPRSCSDVFADSLIAQLPGYEKDDTGVFTDTANYTDQIGECTNLSVGYDHHHSAREVQNVSFMVQVLEWMKGLDQSKLIHVRDAGDYEWPTYASYGGYRKQSNYDLLDNDDHYFSGVEYTRGAPGSIESLVRNYPAAVAELLRDLNIDAHDVREYAFTYYGYL